MELVLDPSVLFLDEPTTGLDSTTSLHLVRIKIFSPKSSILLVDRSMYSGVLLSTVGLLSQLSFISHQPKFSTYFMM
jgi:energy-coupling factor transporter ATP-binding protein EcfA2